jgi:methionine-rich copper-binding protein CopC
LIRKLILCALPLLVAAALVQVAYAHSRPIRFDPPPGVVLSAAPAQVTGWFTQPLRRDPNWSFIRVQDALGTVVSSGEPILSADRKQMTTNLNSNLPAGRYLVTWRTWDDNDGRIFGDCYSFFIGQAAADAAIAANTRLDGGGTCQRIDVSGTEGTPVAGGTPQVTATPEDQESDEGVASSENTADESSGVPAWTLVVGVVGGLAVGGVGGRLLTARP